MKMSEKVYVLHFAPRTYFWVAGEWLRCNEFGQLEVCSESFLAEMAGIDENDEEKVAEQKLYDFLKHHVFEMPEKVDLGADGVFYPVSFEPADYGLKLIGMWQTSKNSVGFGAVLRVYLGENPQDWTRWEIDTEEGDLVPTPMGGWG